MATRELPSHMLVDVAPTQVVGGQRPCNMTPHCPFQQSQSFLSHLLHKPRIMDTTIEVFSGVMWTHTQYCTNHWQNLPKQFTCKYAREHPCNNHTMSTNVLVSVPHTFSTETVTSHGSPPSQQRYLGWCAVLPVFQYA